MKEPTIQSERIPISRELAEYLENNLTAFEQAISRAMILQLLHGWEAEAAVHQALSEQGFIEP